MRNISLFSLFTIVTIVIAFATLTTCGQKIETTKVSFSFRNVGVSERVGSALTAPAAQNGGIIIFGHSEDKRQTFSITLGSESEVKSQLLDNGSWVFEAMGWEGGSAAGVDVATSYNKLEGAARCSKETSTQLTGGNIAVTLLINKANCTAPKFGGSEFFDLALDVNSFRPLKIVNCAATTVFTDNVTSNDTCSSGKYLSVQVMIPRMDLFTEEQMAEYEQSWPPFIHKDFISECYTFSSGTADTNIRVPVGVAHGDLSFAPMIFPYTDAICGGDKVFDDRPYEIAKGHSVDDWSDEGFDNIFVRSDANSSHNVAFIVDRPNVLDGTVTINCDAPPTDYGSIDGAYIECRKRAGKMTTSLSVSNISPIATNNIFIFKTADVVDTVGRYVKIQITTAKTGISFVYEIFNGSTLVSEGSSSNNISLYNTYYDFDTQPPGFQNVDLAWDIGFISLIFKINVNTSYEKF